MSIKAARIRAYYKRHLLDAFQNTNRILQTFYWPFLDLTVIGYTVKWFTASDVNSASIAAIATGILVFWQITVRSTQETSMLLLEEIWARNTANVFSSPISLQEWVCCACLVAVTLAGLVGVACGFIAWIIHGVNLLQWWWLLLPAALLSFFGGLWIGLVSTALLMRFGKDKMVTATFILSWFFLPVSGAFYAIDALPLWLQKIAYAMPMAHCLGGLRFAMQTGQFPFYAWICALVLGIIYNIAAFILLNYMFEKKRELGLSHLDD